MNTMKIFNPDQATPPVGGKSLVRKRRERVYSKIRNFFFPGLGSKRKEIPTSVGSATVDRVGLSRPPRRARVVQEPIDLNDEEPEEISRVKVPAKKPQAKRGKKSKAKAKPASKKKTPQRATRQSKRTENRQGDHNENQGSENQDEAEKGMEIEANNGNELIPPQDNVVNNEGRFADNVPELNPIGYERAVISPDESLTIKWIREIRMPHTFRPPEAETDFSSSRPFLESACIHRSHRSNLYFSKQEVLALRDAVWLRAAYAEIDGNRMMEGKSEQEKWEKVELVSPQGFGIGYFRSKSAEIEHQGFTIMENFVEPMMPFSCLGILERLPEVVQGISISVWFKWMESTFPGEEDMKSNENWGLWAPIINSGFKETDEKANEEGRGRYTSTTRLLMDYCERRERNVKYSERRAAMDVWIGWVVALLNLDHDVYFKSWLPGTGGRLLLTGKDADDQCGHNDFVVRDGESPGYFVIANGPHTTSLLVAPSSHKYVKYEKSRLHMLSRTLEMEEIDIPPFSLFIGHGYLQHAGAGWRGNHSIRYHTYVVPENHLLPDAIAFAYDWSLKAGNGTTPIVLTNEEEGEDEVDSQIDIGEEYNEGEDVEMEEVDEDDDPNFTVGGGDEIPMDFE